MRDASFLMVGGGRSESDFRLARRVYTARQALSMDSDKQLIAAIRGLTVRRIHVWAEARRSTWIASGSVGPAGFLATGANELAAETRLFEMIRSAMMVPPWTFSDVS